ncbi:MAG: hypothetical protein K8S21_05945 [Gemmatimonadetes bacterium]|nr:hypothetical protein [Gemmatimonadota bacterium]
MRNLLLILLLVAPSCVELPRVTSDMPPPWAEFMRSEVATGWLDTSLVPPVGIEMADLQLRIDFAKSQQAPGDSVEFWHMDWWVNVDCARGRVRSLGMTLYDSLGSALRSGAMDGTWLPTESHPSGNTIPWVCRKLTELRP